ncbi:C40 family peptidase [Streptomyces sp. NPDC057011]|uniref:C40 family peptidase n=1 Tax=unclassified Streptomyces TaxID=2593676 RepID=UPI00362E78B8
MALFLYLNAEVSRLPKTKKSRTKHRTPALLLVISVTALFAHASPAQAASPYGIKAVAIAASKKGAPYVYGATGPSAFDCSGLTLYAFRKAGRALPRTADAQYENTLHIPRTERAPGDLVFFPKGSAIGHVGIYAGHDKIWHAPKPGTRVRLERIWTGTVRYTRAN